MKYFYEIAFRQERICYDSSLSHLDVDIKMMKNYMIFYRGIGLFVFYF